MASPESPHDGTRAVLADLNPEARRVVAEIVGLFLAAEIQAAPDIQPQPESDDGADEAA